MLTKAALPSWQTAGLPQQCNSTSSYSKNCFLHVQVNSLSLKLRASRSTSQDPTRSRFSEREVTVQLGPRVQATKPPLTGWVLSLDLLTNKEYMPKYTFKNPKQIKTPPSPGSHLLLCKRKGEKDYEQPST